MAKFEKGNPGGPGRPRGSRDAVNLLLDQLAAGGAETIVKKMIEAASSGDRAAARLVLGRIWPAPKGRPVEIELPEIETAADLVAAHGAVVAAIAAGAITPQDGSAIAAVLEKHRRAFELLAQEERVEALEAAVRALQAKLGAPATPVTPELPVTIEKRPALSEQVPHGEPVAIPDGTAPALPGEAFHKTADALAAIAGAAGRSVSHVALNCLLHGAARFTLPVEPAKRPDDATVPPEILSILTPTKDIFRAQPAAVSVTSIMKFLEDRPR